MLRLGIQEVGRDGTPSRRVFSWGRWMMTKTIETLAALPPLQRRMAETWLERFEQSWHDRKLKECMRALPPQSALRKPLLLAMIERDLVHNWQAERPVTLDD